jgi:DNA-binding transcriptional regulator YiaG
MKTEFTYDLTGDYAHTSGPYYESFFGVLTSTSLPSRRSQLDLPARMISGVLLGAAVSPGDIIKYQQEPVVIENACQQASAPVTTPQKIEFIRESFGVSTSALAEILGVSRPTIYQWIKGQSEPSGDNKARLDRIALTAATWTRAFPSMNMDHWLTDNEPGLPSLLDLLKAADLDTKRIDDVLSRRITTARQAEARIAAERRAAGDAGLPQKENNVPEAVRRWATARSDILRTSNPHG